MKLTDYIDMIRRNPKTTKKVFYAWLVIVALFDIFQSRQDAHYIVDKIYIFWTIFGAIGCFLLIKVGKGLAHLLLSKGENYYG